MSKAWMPFYGGDFLSNTMHLSGAEIGYYVLLLWHCWEHGGCIPDDDKQLARIARVHPPHWAAVKKRLLPFFELTKTGGLAPGLAPAQWMSKRVVLELTKKDEISNKRRAAALQKHTQSQSQSQSHKKKKREATPLSMPADFQPDREFPKARGWTNERINSEAQRFRDHASMNGRTCKNWQAAWRNWVTSPYQEGTNNGRAGPRPLQDDSKSVSRAAKRLAEAAERGEFSFGPKPSLLSAAGVDPGKLLPKR